MRLKTSKLLVAVAVVALAASSMPTSQATTHKKQAATNKQLEIFTWWASGGEAAGLKGMTDLFKKQNPHTKFINAAVAGAAGVNAKAVLVARMIAHNPPDSFQSHAGAELTSYVKAGQVEDLTFLYKKNGWYKVFPVGLIKAITVGGKIYSVPVNIHRANVLWWNPATLAKAGITAAPTTMAEFKADLAKFKAAGIDGIALAGNGDWAIAHLFDQILLADLGTAKYVGLFNGKTSWTGPAVKTAATDLSEILAYGNSSKTLDWPDAGNLVVKTHTAGFFVMGDWASAQWENDGFKPGTDYKWAAFPGTQKNYMWLSDSFTLPKGAKDRDAAIAWLTLAGSLAGQDAFNPKKGSIAVRKDSNPALYDIYLKSAMKDWRKLDTQAGSIVHGVMGNNEFMAKYDSSVGKYYNSGAAVSGVANFQADLANAFKTSH
jgi:glucose/mannose transport system substrate-binding protein